MRIAIGEEVQVSFSGYTWITGHYAGDGRIFYKERNGVSTGTPNPYRWPCFKKGTTVFSMETYAKDRKILLTLLKRHRMLRAMSRTHELPDHFAFAIEAQVEESLAAYKIVKKLVEAEP